MSAIPGKPLPRPVQARSLDAAWARRASRWLPLLAVTVAYATVALHALTLPGVYMDGVNPDYLVVKVLNRAHADIIAWVLPGNYLFGNRAPLLIALYHGTQTFWLGLPFYWLLGTSVESLRLTHAVFGWCVLAATYFCLRRLALPPVTAAVTCTLLAIDAAFSYAFRTQSFITLSGMAWILLSVGLLGPTVRPGRRHWWLSGLFAGLGVAAYFVHGFFVLALLPVVWIVSRGEASAVPTAAQAATYWRPRAVWLAGVVAGTTPYIIGYLRLMKHVGGPGPFAEYYREQAGTLQVLSSALTLPARIGFAWDMLRGVITDAWHHSMMFGEWVEVPGSSLKIALLVGLPLVLWGIAELRRTATAGLRMLIAMPLVFFAVALVFGDRLGGHHFVVLLPLLYAATAIAGRDAASGATARRATLVGGLCLALALGAVNIAGQLAEARTLVRTGGVKLMSDAINRFAADLDAMPRKPFVFFPDWGLAMPVAFLTHGTVGMQPEANFVRARALLCAGQDVAVALIDDPASRRESWMRELGAAPVSSVPYRQRDGVVVFEFVTFTADPQRSYCAPALMRR